MSLINKAVGVRGKLRLKQGHKGYSDFAISLQDSNCKVKLLSFTRDLKRFYFLDEINSTHASYKCYSNFHHVQGDMVHWCSQNGTWVGEEPLCEVDYYMERFRLSLLITVAVIFVCCCMLVPDFLVFYWRKKEAKKQKADVNTIKKVQRNSTYTRARAFASPLGVVPAYTRDYYTSTYEEEFMGYGKKSSFWRGTRSNHLLFDSQPKQEATHVHDTTLLSRIAHAMKKDQDDLV